MLHKVKTIMLVALLAATSCDDNFTYSSYPCYLFIDNSIHQDATLATAMNANAPGIFCTITVDEARRRYTFTNNQGQTSQTNFNATDLKHSRHLGMNGALIVGYGTLTNQFFAYDRECPTCFSPDAIPVRSHPIKPQQDGTASCATCGRRYDISNGGHCISEGGVKGLTQYRASTTGPLGRLVVR